VSAPAILGSGSGSAADLVTANAMLSQALMMARQADIYVVGIGSLESDLVYTRFGLVGQDELRDLSGRAVGDICGRFFDINGQEQPSAFSERIVGIELGDLKRARIAIGAAGGPDKVAPLLGAIRGGLVNVLISDEQTTNHILALDDAYPPTGASE
jgi:deoxyribonucleoside regulator